MFSSGTMNTLPINKIQHVINKRVEAMKGVVLRKKAGRTQNDLRVTFYLEIRTPTPYEDTQLTSAFLRTVDGTKEF
jgi:hypothetical protein